MGAWVRGPKPQERRRMTRTGDRLFVLGTANQVRKALKGQPGFKQCCTVERGIVMVIHTLYRRYFPKFGMRTFWSLGEARRARDNWTPRRKRQIRYVDGCKIVKVWVVPDIPPEYRI